MKRYIKSESDINEDDRFIGDPCYKYILYRCKNHYMIVNQDNLREPFDIVEQFDSDTEEAAVTRFQTYLNQHPRKCDKLDNIYLYISKTSIEGDYSLIGDHIEFVVTPSNRCTFEKCIRIVKNKIHDVGVKFGCKIVFREACHGEYVIYQST